MKLTIDFETRSPVDLKGCGMYVYARHPRTEIQCLAVKVDDKIPTLWIPPHHKCRIAGLHTPTLADKWLQDLIDQADTIHAHNAGFERQIWDNIMAKRYGFKPLPFEKLRCTAAKAAAHALPRDLERAGAAMGIPIQKDKVGYSLMLKMCKPRKLVKKEREKIDVYETDKEINKYAYLNGENLTLTYYYHETADDFHRLCQYCCKDVDAEYALSNALLDLSEHELEVWRMDQEINDRGVYIDKDGVTDLIDMIATQESKLILEIQKITGGFVQNATQINNILKWMERNGYKLPDLQKGTVEEYLKDPNLPADVRRVFEIRQSLGKTSTAKLETFIDWCNEDNRVRGMYLYHGASTGRWSGRGPQTQNLPRESFSPEEVDDILGMSYDMVEAMYDCPIQTASKCIRGMITAPEGKSLICADFSAIEARVVAWLAGEQGVLDAFIAKKDLYKVAAAGIYGVKYEDVNKNQRAIGKVCISEGSLVLTDSGLIPIEKLSLDNRVWDGVEFVKHEGLIDQGIKEVIEYEGLTATPDHKVYVYGQATPIELREAKEKRARLVTSGYGRSPIRTGEDNFKRSESREALDAFCESTMPDLQENKMDKQIQPFQRTNFGMPKLLANHKQKSQDISKEIPRYSKSVQSQAQQVVPSVWSTWYKMSIQKLQRIYPMDREKSTARGLQESRDRQDRQQRELRDREFKTIDKKTECEQQKRDAFSNIQRQINTIFRFIPRNKIFRSISKISSKYIEQFKTFICGTDNREIPQPSKRQTKRVYDIANCGSRHRFTVSNKLVSNCVLALGYQGWLGAFKAMAAGYGVEVSEEQAKEIIINWRKSNPNIVSLWHQLEHAAINAIRTGKAYDVGALKLGIRGRFLCMRLPNGRVLSYLDPKIIKITTPYGVEKDGISFQGENSVTKQFGKQMLYGGVVAENATQAMSRDILVEAMLKLRKAGLPIVMHVHDEIVCEIPENKATPEFLKAFEQTLSITPSWAKGLPLGAEGWVGRRYRK